MHRTQNVRRSGVSVVPRTDLKTEGEQPNNRETGYREYRFKRNSRRNDWWEWMFERMMRFESNLRYGSVDWVLGLLLFYLIYLLSFFPRTSTAWDQAPQWGEKAKKISEKAKKKSVSEATSRAIVPVHRSAHFALQFFLFHPCFVLFRLLLFFCRFLLVSRSSGTQKIKIYSVPR